jgi:hypothetical protein
VKIVFDEEMQNLVNDFKPHSRPAQRATSHFDLLQRLRQLIGHVVHILIATFWSEVSDREWVVPEEPATEFLRVFRFQQANEKAGRI